MIKKWEEKEGGHVCSGALFNYFTKRRISPDGKKEGHFDILECSPWTNIFALNKENEVILVEQYRHGIDDVTLEIPGGGVNRGENFLEGAKRELLEETGYSSCEWVKLGELQVNPAFMTNTCTTFLALNCEKTQNQNLDPMEEIEVKLLPLKDFEKKIKKGEVAHSLVVSAFALYILWKQEN